MGGKNLTFTGIRFPDRPARSDSLCKIRFLAHTTDTKADNIQVQEIGLVVVACTSSVFSEKHLHFLEYASFAYLLTKCNKIG
jgi:hypothetical protein